MSEKKEFKKAIVREALPNTLFKISFFDDEENEEIVSLAGKMRYHRIRILVGDKVEIDSDPYGGRGKIVKRL